MRFFGWCFLLLLAALIVALAWLRVNLHEHCPAPYKSALNMSGYALQLRVDAPAAECRHDD